MKRSKQTDEKQNKKKNRINQRGKLIKMDSRRDRNNHQKKVNLLGIFPISLKVFKSF